MREMVSFLDRDVAILNLSLGCYTEDNQPPLLMQRAIQIMTPRILVVAAAGNHRQPQRPRPFWPAALDDVIAVGAYGDDYRPAPFTPQAPGSTSSHPASTSSATISTATWRSKTSKRKLVHQVREVARHVLRCWLGNRRDRLPIAGQRRRARGA